MSTVNIAHIPIGDGYPVRVCAEIGTNHQGRLPLAFRMIEAAKEAGADFVKFQVRTPELAVPKAEWHEVRDTPWGKLTKLDYRKRVEFSAYDYEAIDEHCRKVGILWFCSYWDQPSLDRIHKLNVDFVCVKIPSARLHDDELLRSAAKYGRPVILSTGMSEWSEVKRAVNILTTNYDTGGKADWRAKPQIIPMQCTSAYPARHDESNLRVIRTYKRELGFPVGFSSHKIGIATCVLAVAVGANIIERHLTLDRGRLGSDHRMSSEPEDMERLVKEIRYAEACLGDGKKVVYPSEEAERKRLRGAV